jgi:hypothetical protein
MRNQHPFFFVTIICIALIVKGCGGTTQVLSEESFPELLAPSRAFYAVVIFTPEFSNYVAKPSSKTKLSIGSAQENIMRKTFSALFDTVDFFDSEEKIEQAPDIIIYPSVVESQIAVPSQNYLNVYEIWIKYNLKLTDVEGNLIDNWFMPVYGKTSDSFMLQKEKAIGSATRAALRDIGAKLSLDFYRIPSVERHLREKSRRS